MQIKEKVVQMEMMLFVEKMLESDFGILGLWLIVIVCQMAVDIITGFMQAVVNKDVKSGKISSGLIKKGAILLLLVVIIPFTILMPNSVSYGIVIFVYTIESINEIVSICENLHNMGVDVGFMQPLLEILNVYKNQDEVKEESEEEK